jgi:trimethylamine--corrinoid protein Co-methyltransferase
MIYEAAGMHASLLGCCYETLVLDNDAIGAALRTIRGIEVSDESCSVDVIREVTMAGPNHYLGSGQTISLMQSEYVYPEVGDRLSPKDWADGGRKTALDRAEIRVREILASHFPNPIAPEIDARLRARLPIRLPVDAMGPPVEAPA